jgi:hypothetical protein
MYTQIWRRSEQPRRATQLLVAATAFFVLADVPVTFLA